LGYKNPFFANISKTNRKNVKSPEILGTLKIASIFSETKTDINTNKKQTKERINLYNFGKFQLSKLKG
jgi:hypothetical protein